MALARFFDRTYAAVGGMLGVDRATLETCLADQRIVVRCGPTCIDKGNDAWIAELLINLAARMYPRLIVEAEESIFARVRDIAQRVNPVIDIELGSVSAPTVIVEIGGAASTQADAICPSANGWVAQLDFGGAANAGGAANPYAAGAAACLAASEVFRRIFKQHTPSVPPREHVRVSLIDFGESTGYALTPPAMTLGTVAFVGLGAVANGALWALGKHEDLTGQFSLVDDERVELSNLQRYVLAMDADVGVRKTEHCAAALSQPGLVVATYASRLEEFADSVGSPFMLPTIVVSVDNPEGRRAAQALLPRLVVNGWTGNGALGASWHEFHREDACLSCLYYPKGVGKSQVELVAEAFGLPYVKAAELWVSDQPLREGTLDDIARHLGVSLEVVPTWRGRCLRELYTSVLCGSVGLDLQGIGRLEAVPLAHQSAFAGILMAAELEKRLDAVLRTYSQQEGYLVWDDILRPPPQRWIQPRSRASGCICGDKTYQEVYRKKWPVA